MFCRWSETLNFTQHDPSIKGNQSCSGKQHSPITPAISVIAIYFYTYIDHRQVHSYAISQASPSMIVHSNATPQSNPFFKTKDFSSMRFLAVWVSAITCIIVNLLRQVISSLLPHTRKHILSSLQTLKDLLNVCSLIHPGITLEPVLQSRTWVTSSRAFSMIESMSEAQRMSDIQF